MRRRDETDKVIFERGEWRVHEVDIELANGAVSPRIYLEWPNSVMIFAITENDEVLCIKEFCRAVNGDEIFVPKGKIDEGEDLDFAAQRELQEEVGVKAKELVKITSLKVYPNHLQGETTIFLARDLEESKLPHDANEEIEIVRVPVKDMTDWIESGKITEARTIAGWFLVKKYLQSHENNFLER